MPRPRPAAAPVPFRRRTRIVAGAKILLPLAALALLSTVFLLARERTGEVEIPFARIEEIAREPRIDRPRLAGQAPDGTAVSLTADRLRPAEGGLERFTLAGPRLETRDPAGARVRLEAGTGEVDGPARRLTLSGGVTVGATGGYALTAGTVEAELDSGSIATDAVRGRAPFGTIEAGGLTLTQGGTEDARLVFHDGVRLLYLPDVTPAAEAPE